MNEAQTRFNKIDPKLRDAGWGIVPGSKKYDRYQSLVNLAADIKNYFETNGKALEVLIFRRKHELSVFRRFALSARFYAEFKKLYEK